ncbi:hypothetical protein ACQY0O_000345 [Thecaphora frezii]
MARASERGATSAQRGSDGQQDGEPGAGPVQDALLDFPLLHSRRQPAPGRSSEPFIEALGSRPGAKISPETLAKLVVQDAGGADHDRGLGLQKLVRQIADQGEAILAGGKGKKIQTHRVAGSESEEWVQVRQVGEYLEVRRRRDASLLEGSKAAISKLLYRRSMISHPPLIPNSNTRLLIWMIIGCIIVVGIITLLVQEFYYRHFAARSARDRRRRHSSQSYFSQQPTRNALQRQVTAFARTHLNGDVGTSTSVSVEEEEELITTPPIISRRSSARSVNPSEPGGSDDEEDRKVSSDLHYFALPLGLGIGYSHSRISDRNLARARLNRLAETAARRRRVEQSSRPLELARSSSTQWAALPITGTKATSPGMAGALRSGARSLREFCSGALETISSSTGAESRYASSASEEEGDGVSPTTPLSLPHWNGANSDDITPLATGLASNDYWTSIPANEPLSSIALGSLAPSASLANQKGKAKAQQSVAPADGYTLVDLSPAATEPNNGGAKAYALPDLTGHGRCGAGPRTSEEEGSVSSTASSPSPSASTVARHPLVEHLRREGRSNGERRVGNGTPTVRPLIKNA